MKRLFNFLIVALLCVMMGCGSALTQNSGESDAEFLARVHEHKTAQVMRVYILVDVAMQIAKSQGAGDDAFWERYAKADALFMMGFRAWQAGDKAQGDFVDAALAALKALARELNEAEGKELVGADVLR